MSALGQKVRIEACAGIVISIAVEPRHGRYNVDGSRPAGEVR